MVRAARKRSKKSGKRLRPPRAKVIPAERAKAKIVRRLRWEEDGHFTDPIIYAYDARAGEVSPVLRTTWLPELVGLLLKAIQYFGINGRPGAPKQPLPSTQALRTFFRHQQLSNGEPPSPHLVRVMATLCLPSKGGRPRKGQPSPLDELCEGQNARERERILLRLLSPPDEQSDTPSDAPPEPENL